MLTECCRALSTMSTHKDKPRSSPRSVSHLATVPHTACTVHRRCEMQQRIMRAQGASGPSDQVLWVRYYRSGTTDQGTRDLQPAERQQTMQKTMHTLILYAPSLPLPSTRVSNSFPPSRLPLYLHPTHPSPPLQSQNVSSPPSLTKIPPPPYPPPPPYTQHPPHPRFHPTPFLAFHLAALTPFVSGLDNHPPPPPYPVSRLPPGSTHTLCLRTRNPHNYAAQLFRLRFAFIRSSALSLFASAASSSSSHVTS